MKRLHTIKVDDEEWAKWKAAAKLESMTLSSWIRHRCHPANSVGPLPGTIGNVSEFEHDGEEVIISLSDAPTQTRKACKHGLLFCKKCK